MGRPGEASSRLFGPLPAPAVGPSSRLQFARPAEHQTGQIVSNIRALAGSIKGRRLQPDRLDRELQHDRGVKEGSQRSLRTNLSLSLGESRCGPRWRLLGPTRMLLPLLGPAVIAVVAVVAGMGLGRDAVEHNS